MSSNTNAPSTSRQARWISRTRNKPANAEQHLNTKGDPLTLSTNCAPEEISELGKDLAPTPTASPTAPVAATSAPSSSQPTTTTTAQLEEPSLETLRARLSEDFGLAPGAPASITQIKAVMREGEMMTLAQVKKLWAS